MSGAGALLFARFAFPPNELGYCGPDAAPELLERVAAGAGGRALAELARGFAGAWPYLELIAAANGVADPLARPVVEAYWIGNRMLQRVDPATLAGALATRFPLPRADARQRLLAPVAAGAAAHHSFHVFGVYPWVGMLREGRAEAPLTVLDRCRIRWGRVESVAGDHAVVTSRPLRWTGGRLELGPPRPETARVARDGHHLAPGPVPRAWYALHWDWLCQPLTPVQLRTLRRCTVRQLAAVNGSGYPAPALVLS